MELKQEELYELDINKEWNNFLKKHKLMFNSKTEILYKDSSKFFKTLGYYPVDIDAHTLRLYKNNAVNGGNTVDLLYIGLSDPIRFIHMNFNATAYIEIIKYGLNQQIIKKDFKDEIPKFIKSIISLGFRIIEKESGTQSEEWTLIKKVDKIIFYWRIKLDKKQKPILSSSFVIPQSTIESIIESTCRETKAEKKYVKYFGLLNKKEILESEVGIKKDLLKTIKTHYFENLNRINNYFEWLKENKLEDNLKNAEKYHLELLKEIEKENDAIVRQIKIEKGGLN